MRNGLLWGSAIAMLSLGSCASLPLPDEGNKTLLVAPVTIGYTTYSGFPLAYEFGLAETQRRLSVTVRNGVAVFAQLPPGAYTIDRVYTVPGPEIAGGLYADSREPEQFGPLRFTLKEGEITILPVTIAVSVEGRGPEIHVQRWTPSLTDRNRVLADLSRYGRFDRWRIHEEEAAAAGAVPFQALPPRQVQSRPRFD